MTNPLVSTDHLLRDLANARQQIADLQRAESERLQREMAERQRVEVALRESEARFRRAFEDAAIGIALVGLDGRFLQVNRTLCQLLGYSSAELMGMTFDVVTHPDDRVASWHVWRDALAGRIESVQFEKRYRRKDGQTVWAILTSSLLRDSAGQPLSFISQVQDITIRRQIEHELLQISELERQRIGQDLHDGLCQQLAGIAYMGEVLRQKLASKALEETSDVTQIVTWLGQAMAQARGLAKGLLPVELDANGLAAALQELTAQIGQVFGITCRFDADQAVAVPNNTVATHVYYVAHEAVRNAVKHGHATIVSLRLGLADGAAILRIDDNGTGFSDPPEPTTHGMGLRIMRYRANRIGASLAIEPGQEGGTVVTLRFQPS